MVAAVCLAGCGNDSGADLYPDGGSSQGDGGGAPAGAGGLPCEVKAILANHCQTCHGATPANGAPFPLVGYQDLTRLSATGAPIAERVLARITSTDRPMPPSPGAPVPAEDIAAIEAWVKAGAPISAADCSATPPGPFDGPVVCTSGTRWRDGNEGSQHMHPGMACITCHQREDDDATARFKDPPQFRIAGTAYPTGHEPNDCNGAADATIEVIDASGEAMLLPTNAAGNFFTTRAVAFPIRVAVLAGGKRRAMVMSPPRGDCNSCHTQDGSNGAPGRITLP